MKNNLIITIFLSCCISYNCFSQFVIAGQTTGNNITYQDINPDIELDAPIFNGDIDLLEYIDINKDGENDFKISVSMSSGVSHSVRTSTITPLGNNQISIGRSETKIGYWGDTVTIFVAKVYNAVSDLNLTRVSK